MTEEWEIPLPGEEERAGPTPRPGRWWVALVVLAVAGAFLANLFPGFLPRERVGSGTGFVIAEGGYVLTAAHVVAGATEITVRGDRRWLRAITVATSTERDLALLRVEEPLPMPVAVVARDRPKLGEVVTVVGHPARSARPIVLSTHVAGVRWSAAGPEGTVLRDLIATQDPFQPGYSGAPLVNAFGEVVGVVAGNLTRTGGLTYGFAVSIQRAAAWLAGHGVRFLFRQPSAPLSETELADLIGASVVQVQARTPTGGGS